MERPTGNPHCDVSPRSQPIYPFGATHYSPASQQSYRYPTPSPPPLQADVGLPNRQLEQLNRALIATRQQNQQLQRQLESERKSHRQDVQKLDCERRNAADSHAETKRAATKQIQQLRSELDEAKADRQQSFKEVQALRQELKHLANASLAEQQQLGAKQESESARQRSLIASHSARIKQLETDASKNSLRLGQWRAAHDRLLNLSQWQLEQYDTDRRELDLVQNELTLLDQEFGELERQAAAEQETNLAEVQRLRASVRILSSDHETVELVNADLDHYCDELTSQNQSLQREISFLQCQAGQSEQRLEGECRKLSEQLRTSQLRLQSLSEENKSLVLSVSQLKTAGQESDANLFAKDQEIAAIKKAAEQTESELMDQKQKLREMESSTRAAQASALLQASEAEQQFAIQREQLEIELQNSQDVREQQAEQLNQLTEQRDDMLARLSDFKNNQDQQQTIVGLKEQLGESVRQQNDLQQQIRQKSDLVQTLQTELDGWAVYENPIGEARRLSEQLSKQSARFAKERESLYRRIEQLQRVRQLRRAA